MKRIILAALLGLMAFGAAAQSDNIYPIGPGVTGSGAGQRKRASTAYDAVVAGSVSALSSPSVVFVDPNGTAAEDNTNFTFNNTTNNLTVEDLLIGSGAVVGTTTLGLTSTSGDLTLTATAAGNDVILAPNATGYSLIQRMAWQHSATQAITAASDTITGGSSTMATTIVLDPNANITLTSTPSVTDGLVAGQFVWITVADGEANTVTVQDNSILANSGVFMDGSNFTISTRVGLGLIYNGTNWQKVASGTNDFTGSNFKILNSGAVTLEGVSYSYAMGLETADPTTVLQQFYHAVNDSSGVGILLGRSRGTPSAQTITGDGDTLGIIAASGYDGVDQELGYSMQFLVDGATALNTVPSRIAFLNFLTEVMALDNANWVGIGNGVTPTIINGIGDLVLADDLEVTDAAHILGNANLGNADADKMTLVGETVLTPGGSQTISAVGNTIDATGSGTILRLNPDNDYTLTSTPSVQLGVAGQVVILTAADGETNIVTLQDDDTLVGSRLELNATTRSVTAHRTLTLYYNGADWVEIAYSGGGAVATAVAQGGTGATSLTDGGILFGNGTAAVGATGVLTNGQLLIGDGTEEPTAATLTGTANEITVTNGAGSITLDIPNSVTLVTLTTTGTRIMTPSAAQAITGVGVAVLANAEFVQINPDGNYVLTVNPMIADGTLGQIVHIMTPDAEANTVTLTDEAGDPGSNVQLGAATRVIGDLDVLTLIFNGTYWVEQSYTDN